MKTLILNKSNIVEGSSNTRYKYKFPRTVHFKKGAKIALSKLSFYYSWPNVTSSNQNNSFSYQWFDLSGNLTKTYTLTIPDGYYTYSDLNSWLYEELCNRGHFVTYPTTTTTLLGTSNGKEYTTSTKYVFFELQENATYYSCQLTMYGLPNYAASGAVYSSIGSVTGYQWRPPTAITGKYQTGKIIIPSGTNFSKYLGFNAGTLGAGEVTTSAQQQDLLSDFTPELVPVASVLVLNSMCSNKFSNPSTLVYSFSATVDYGAMIDVEPNNWLWVDIQPGAYNEFTIELRDQDFKQMYILDSNNIIIMVLDENEDNND